MVWEASGDLEKVLIAKDLQVSTDNYYLYGAGLVSEGGVSATNRQYYLEDGLGNVRVVTDDEAGLVDSYAYDPYGNILSENEGTDFLYKGEQLSAETGLYYMRARYYDPSTGRFTSQDPVEGAIMLPQSQNGYSFVHNNPVNFSDPSGEVAPLAVLAAVWAVAEVGLTVADAHDFAQTLQDPNANLCDKTYSGALFAAGVIGPGGGYGQLAKAFRWGKVDTLAKHLKDHGADFGVNSAADYAKMANDFFNNQSGLLKKVDPGDGTIRLYDPSTNTFGAYNPDGTTKTFFKPRDGASYWDTQPGK